MRMVPLVSGEIYHVYNRGVEKRNIFMQGKDYIRFLRTFYYYQFAGPKPKYTNSFMLKYLIPKQNKKIVEILCYCLMPNHFHFLTQQLTEKGISNFIRLLSISYTKFFNIKYKRVGPLFQGSFKAVRVKSDEQLVHLSRYIHLNPIVSGIADNFDRYQWSSYREYAVGEKLYCNTEEILNLFPNRQNYCQFLEDQKDYGTTLEILKHSSVDEI